MIKSEFYKQAEESSIKATSLWKCINIDFKGPMLGLAPYIFIVTNECLQ